MDELEIKTNNSETVSEAPAHEVQHQGPSAMVRHDFAPTGARITLRSLRAETEMQAISQALEQTGWNRKRAAQLLSISYRGLLYKIRQHNITRNQITQSQDLAGVPKRTKMADTLSNWEPSGLAVAGGGTPGKD